MVRVTQKSKTKWQLMSCARIWFLGCVQGHSQGSKVSIRGLRGHLLHTVTFRVVLSFRFSIFNVTVIVILAKRDIGLRFFVSPSVFPVTIYIDPSI